MLILEAEAPLLSMLLTLDEGAGRAIALIASLRQVALAKTDKWSSVVTPNSVRILMNCIDCSILEGLTTRPVGFTGSDPIKSIYAAAHVFLYCALRDVEKNSPTLQALVKRLQFSLTEVEIQLVSWKSHMPALIWVLFVGHSATHHMPGNEGTWFSSRLKIILQVFQFSNILSKQGLEQHLKSFVWTDQFFGHCLDVFWADFSAGLPSLCPFPSSS